MNVEIVPAIMPEDFADIEAHAGLVRRSVKTVQLDLMDGDYVPEATWPFVGRQEEVQELISEARSLPFWEDLDYELDLMISKPEDDLDTWLHLGASRVIIHYASVGNWDPIREVPEGIRSFVNLGIAVTIHDDVEAVVHLIKEGTFDFIQVMGIAHVGYQGEPFEEGALDLARTLHERFPDMPISVDGGVSPDTIQALYDAGATRFVSGSHVFGGGVATENVMELFETLRITDEKSDL